MFLFDYYNTENYSIYKLFFLYKQLSMIHFLSSYSSRALFPHSNEKAQQAVKITLKQPIAMLKLKYQLEGYTFGQSQL